MFVVAITRWARPLEQELVELAAIVGEVPYDLRLRLAGPLPVVFGRTSDRQEALDHLALLRGRGHGTVACDLDRVAASDAMVSPRDYELAPDAFVALMPDGPARMPYADLVAIVRAGVSRSESSTVVVEDKKFSATRAALSGGLMMRKRIERTQHTRVEEREQVLYLIRKNARDPMCLRETRLRHGNLGDRLGPTSLGNFNTLIEVLRSRAPQALYDDCLLTKRRKSAIHHLSMGAKNRRAGYSNASETDLAAHLLAVAHLSRQL